MTHYSLHECLQDTVQTVSFTSFTTLPATWIPTDTYLTPLEAEHAAEPGETPAKPCYNETALASSAASMMGLPKAPWLWAAGMTLILKGTWSKPHRTP